MKNNLPKTIFGRKQKGRKQPKSLTEMDIYTKKLDFLKL